MNLPPPPTTSFTAPERITPPDSPSRGLRVPLAIRMGLLIALMAVLVLAAGAGGFWFSSAATDQIENMGLSNDLAARINTVQMRWMALTSMFDAATMARPTDEDFDTLNARLIDLNQAFDGLAGVVDEAAGTSSEDNRQILLNLRTVYARTDSLASEIFELAADQRYDEALQAHKSGLPELQASLLDELAQLDANVASEVFARSLRITQTQNFARILSGLATALAFLLALYVFWIGRRAIIHPLASLTNQVNRLAEGDFSPSEQCIRRDEIGDLAEAVERMAEAVRTANIEMEHRILERTQALERRTIQVQVAAQTARDIASARGLGQLLDNAVDLIRERFGFYHAGIFLTDARGEYQTLRAATGEAGRAMLARAHNLRIGESGKSGPTGLVGAAAYRGEPLVSSDVSQDQAHFKNPLLPETRSEAALPLKVGGAVIGVLDVQSRQPDAFDPESLNILQVMADQLAIAIQNTSLLNEVRRSLADMQQAYGELERKAWLRFFQASPDLGYIYDGVDIHPISAAGQSPSSALANNPHPDEQPIGTHTSPDASVGASTPFTLPLRVRGQEIGELEVWSRHGELSDEETYLLTALNNRLGQILESARLYEETQARAAREELINRLTSQISRAADLDGVLRSAAIELAGIPAVREATVALLTPEPDPTPITKMDNKEADGGGNGHRP